MRALLYLIARIWGDINAIRKGRIGQRIKNRIAGRIAGKLLSKIK